VQFIHKCSYKADINAPRVTQQAVTVILQPEQYLTKYHINVTQIAVFIHTTFAKRSHTI